jgi:inner membrane protein
VIRDLRMGQEPNYVFSFRVGEIANPRDGVPPQAVGSRGDVREGLRWLGRRMLGEPLPPPRAVVARER